MQNINVGRVVLSGIITGVIVDIIEGLSNGWLLAAQWEAALATIGRPPFSVTAIVLFNVYGLIIGLSAAWIYAAFRPGFGAGPQTALYAALTTWVLGYFLPYFAIALIGLPVSLMVTIGIVGLVEIIVATEVGAYFYRD
jgi:hypothetical protein